VESPGKISIAVGENEKALLIVDIANLQRIATIVFYENRI